MICIFYQGAIIEEKLTDKISSVVADKLVQVTNNASTDNTREAELDAKLLDTTRDIIDQEMNPEMEELRYVGDDSPDQVAEHLALKICQNAQPDDGKINTRSFLGIRENWKKYGPPPFFMPPTWLPHLVALSDGE